MYFSVIQKGLSFYRLWMTNNLNKLSSNLLFVLLLSLFSIHVHAKTLNNDPAWKISKLDNGFVWQLLAASHRPSDPIEIRFVLNSSVLQENEKQKGATVQLIKQGLANAMMTSTQLSQWAVKSGDQIEPIITIGYDQVIISLSLPNDKPENLKTAIEWLGKVVFSDVAKINEIDQSILDSFNGLIATKPSNIQDSFWRYRLNDSVLASYTLDFSNHSTINDLKLLEDFKNAWFTPDAMQLFIVGKIEPRVASDAISKTFGEFSSKREKAPQLAVLQPLKEGSLVVMDESIKQPILSIYSDSSWYPIATTDDLVKYWRMELAREAIYQRVSADFNKSDKHQLGFECSVAYQRQLCSFHLTDSTNKFASSLNVIAKKLAELKKKGITEGESKLLLEAKNKELNALFTTYAKTDLATLINNRVQSQNIGVVDLALEEYQILRTDFLNTIKIETINDDIEYLISRPITLVIRQPIGSDELNIGAMLESYKSIVFPNENDNAQEINPSPETIPEKNMTEKTSLLTQ